jgi:hypothetical protein
VEKTKHVYVLPKLGDCIFATISFDLWMSKETHDIFSVVIIFLGYDYKAKQMILGYLKQQKLLVKPWLPTNIKELFGQYGLRKKNLHM